MQTYFGPLNNSDLHATIWHDGQSYRWDIYVYGAQHITTSGRAETFEDAMKAAIEAA